MLKLNASSVVVGAVLAIGAMLVMGQAGPQPQYVSWGPPKAGVVTIFQAPGGSISPGADFLIYTVPNDRWFTMTSCTTEASLGLQVAELYAGNLVVRGVARQTSTEPVHADSAVGWVFRPGSQIVLHNTMGAIGSFQYSFHGYQTRD